jgi:hypothetical protein
MAGTEDAALHCALPAIDTVHADDALEPADRARRR